MCIYPEIQVIYVDNISLEAGIMIFIFQNNKIKSCNYLKPVFF